MSREARWMKLGLLPLPPGLPEWGQTHMMMPTPEYVADGRIRIYFGTRNLDNQSSIARCYLSEQDGKLVIDGAPELVLSPGRLGCFDDNGVLPSCVVAHESRTYLFYVGFRPGGTTRMELFGGLAIENEAGDGFQRFSEAPIIGRQSKSPLLNTAPWVVADGEEWVMYFVAGLEWVNRDLPRYHIRQARSKDLSTWNLSEEVAVELEPGENALARPVVTVLPDGSWNMWFASKGENYQPHRAVSLDGRHWKRLGAEIGLLGGYDAEEKMQEYFVPIKINGNSYLLYNGSDYGRGGILVAKKEME